VEHHRDLQNIHMVRSEEMLDVGVHSRYRCYLTYRDFLGLVGHLLPPSLFVVVVFDRKDGI
jgi:hypothetical protein